MVCGLCGLLFIDLLSLLLIVLLWVIFMLCYDALVYWLLIVVVGVVWVVYWMLCLRFGVACINLFVVVDCCAGWFGARFVAIVVWLFCLVSLFVWFRCCWF